jgi:hypothetical protein
MTYYLVDGIYPSYLIFLKLIRLPITEQDTLFVKYQEACRKDVECAFEVLQARIQIIRGPTRMWDGYHHEDLYYILHNMIVEDE